MAERSNAAVLKTVEVKASGGPNPSPSASKNLNRTLGLGSFSLFFILFRFSALYTTPLNRLYRLVAVCIEYLVNRIQADGLCRESRLT